MNIVAVGAGSNINPEINIQSACEILAKEQTLLKTSGIIKTRPIGFMEQDDFLNCVFLVSTKMEKESFGLYLKEIESRLNRERTVNKYGPEPLTWILLCGTA
ncbi:MAG: 2-amino-4-hydroxy-6-hydroxymethyldihydropteridine diphosphokinase [bacterium]